MRTFAIILVLTLLGACGTKTGLTLPPKPTPAGAAQAASPSTSKPPADDSTPDTKADSSKAGDAVKQ